MTEILTRSAPLAPSTFRREGAVAFVDAIITTGAEVRRSFGAERLAITREAVDLPEVAPLRDNHSSRSIRDILGRVSGFRFEPGAIVATLEIRDATAADLVERGDVSGVSIGYVPTAHTDSREGNRLVRTQTAWSLREVSLTDNPADTAATTRSTSVAEQTTTTEADADPAPQPTIRAHVAPVGSEDPAFGYALREEALACRMSGSEPSAGARQFAAFGFADHAALALRAAGDTGLGTLSREGVLHRAMHGTSDFPALLQGAGNRVLRAGYEVAASPLKSALVQHVTASDFRQNDILALGGFGTLAEVTEHGEITATSTSEAKESWRLKTFGRTFSLTRKAIINDDLGAFGRVTVELGKAAAETENAALAALLVSNPVMGDGVALFHADHHNLAGSSFGTIGLEAARKAMRGQRGISGEIISVTPKYLVVGPELETAAEVLLASITPPTTEDVNPFAGRFTLLVEPRLTGQSWYLFAAPSEVPVLLLGHLASAPGPQISSRDGWEVLGREFRVVLDFGVAVTDHRGATKNAS